MFYGLTLYLIKNPKHITKAALKIQFSIFREFPVSPRANQHAQFSLLFSSIKQKTSLIAKVWTIVYTFPIELINTLRVFLHPLEEQLLVSAYKLFEIINKKSLNEILDFTKALEGFGLEDSILWQEMNNTLCYPKKNDSERRKALEIQIKDEIQKLKDTPISEEIWSSKPYIRILTEVLGKIVDVAPNK